jgi:hypothetical protein
MRLPHLPNEYRWKVVANTYLEYSDDMDVDGLTECENNVVHIPERTTIVLVGEPAK